MIIKITKFWYYIHDTVKLENEKEFAYFEASRAFGKRESGSNWTETWILWNRADHDETEQTAPDHGI